MMAAGPMNTRLEAANTLHEVETTQLDLRYESCRLKQAGLEERLLG